MCEGPCKNYYHSECARQKGLIVPESIKPISSKIVKQGKLSLAVEESNGEQS